MNTRMQITIPEADHARVAENAAAMGISIAEYMRRLVRRDLENRPPSTADVSELVGIGDSGGSDVAADKQRYLAEAVAADKVQLHR